MGGSVGIIHKIIGILFLFATTTVLALPAISDSVARDYENTKQVLRSQGYIDTQLEADLQYLKQIKYSVPREMTEMEVYLTHPGSGYGFSRAEDSEKELIRIIEETQKRPHSSEKELIIGDAYHWLGHLYQERFDLLKAFESFVRSFFHYRLTSLSRSPRINSRVEVHEHSIFHLSDISKYIRRSVSGIQYYENVILPRQAIQSCKEFFRASGF